MEDEHKRSCIKILKSFKKLIIDPSTHYMFTLSELKELRRLNMLFSASYSFRFCEVSRDIDGKMTYKQVSFSSKYNLRKSARRFQRQIKGEL
jgi:hypothetical protein